VGSKFVIAAAVAVAVAVILVAHAKARRLHARVDVLHILEEIQQVLFAVQAAIDNYALIVAAMALTALLGYTSFLGASLLRPTERPAMQVLSMASAVAVFEGHRRLAAQENARDKRQNKFVLLLEMLPFCCVSISFASFGLYGNAVAPDLKQMEAVAWAEYYRSSRAAIAAKAGELRDAAAAHCAETSANLLSFRTEVYKARLENRALQISPEQAALASAEKHATTWQHGVVAITLPPASPGPDRQNAEADIATSLEEINRLAADAPPPLVLRGLTLPRYDAPSTELLSRALDAARRHETQALFCVVVCAALELFPLAALLMRRRRVYLHEPIESLRQSVVMICAAFRRSWSRDVNVITEESTPTPVVKASSTPAFTTAEFSSESRTALLGESVIVEFDPPVRARIRIEWKRKPSLATSTFGDVHLAIRSAVDEKLSAAGHRLLEFVTPDRRPLTYDAPLLAQLNQETLLALCEPVSKTNEGGIE
jgi:hypothetical protein